jgi:hypothetical protein
MKSKLLLPTLIIAALIVITVSSPVIAARAFGRPDCGQWIKDTEGMKSYNRMWLVGFMSGLNFGDEQRRDSLAKVSAEQIYLWMDNYCKANPLENLLTGGENLMNELRK